MFGEVPFPQRCNTGGEQTRHRAAAMVTPIGDKKRLLPAESAVSSSGCAGRGRLKSGSSRKKKWKHARLPRIFKLPCQKRNGCPKLLSAIFPDFS